MSAKCMKRKFSDDSFGSPVHEHGPDRIVNTSTVLYLTTIGAFSVDAVGAIENTSQVFQPDERFWAANSQ